MKNKSGIVTIMHISQEHLDQMNLWAYWKKKTEGKKPKRQACIDEYFNRGYEGIKAEIAAMKKLYISSIKK